MGNDVLSLWGIDQPLGAPVGGQVARLGELLRIESIRCA